MKNLTKKTVFNSIFLVLMVQSGTAFAHDYYGSLGSAANATDWFTVNCATPGVKLYASIIDTGLRADKILESVKLSKKTTLSATDSTDGGNATGSPGIILNNGAGVYNIYVSKSAAGAQTYHLLYHCQNSTGVHTTTPIKPTIKQNQ